MPNSNSKQKTQNSSKVTKVFEKLSTKVSGIVGSPYWFVFSIMIVLVWIPSGFFLGFGEIWHLIINSTTTILTFLMMSLLHASQSKWEKRMERIQVIEKSHLKAIAEDTEKLASGTSHKRPDDKKTNHQVSSIR